MIYDQLFEKTKEAFVKIKSILPEQPEFINFPDVVEVNTNTTSLLNKWSLSVVEVNQGPGLSSGVLQIQRNFELLFAKRYGISPQKDANFCQNILLYVFRELVYGNYQKTTLLLNETHQVLYNYEIEIPDFDSEKKILLCKLGFSVLSRVRD